MIHMIVKEDGKFLGEYEELLHMVETFGIYHLEHKIYCSLKPNLLWGLCQLVLFIFVAALSVK